MFLTNSVLVEWAEEYSYSLSTLGGNVGGLAGLLLGASVLTALQVVELLGAVAARALLVIVDAS